MRIAHSLVFDWITSYHTYKQTATVTEEVTKRAVFYRQKIII